MYVIKFLHHQNLRDSEISCTRNQPMNKELRLMYNEKYGSSGASPTEGLDSFVMGYSLGQLGLIDSKTQCREK